MVAAVRRGASLRAVARRLRVSLSTVQYWVQRAGGERLDRVDWADAPRGGRRVQAATSPRMEDLVLATRRTLQDRSPLGEYGAAAIHRRLQERGLKRVPAVRTIGRILERRGVLDGRRRVRQPPPPKGWHLPPVAQRRAELDSFDFVEGLVIRGGAEVMALNVVSLQGGLCGTWLRSAWTAKTTLTTLLDHWRGHGLPDYAQFDNDTIFQGNHQAPDSFGRVIRLCLALGVIPVFAPPRETGFQASIENYNGRWQQKVWQRFQHRHLADLTRRSDAFVHAARQRAAPRRDAAPPRRPIPQNWKLNLQLPLRGTVIFLRRTNDRGEAELLGQRFLVDALWPHRLVRAEVDLTRQRIRFYRLRRREPNQQPLLKSIPYKRPTQRFRE
jgi:putative transposase